MAVLRVLEIFESLQGEGYWSGAPMTFVRLAGCNAPELGLDCLDWCDTRASWDPASGIALVSADVVSRVRLPRMCLTGGEPLLQDEGVAELVAAAHQRGVRVHLETNGTVESVCEFDWVTVSPKPPAYVIRCGWEGRIDELKFVVDEAFEAAAAERTAAAHPGAIVCLQPEWGRGPADPRALRAMERAVSLVMSHPEWRLSLQTHKFLGIR